MKKFKDGPFDLVRKAFANMEPVYPQPRPNELVAKVVGWKGGKADQEMPEMPVLPRTPDLSNLPVSPFVNHSWSWLDREAFEERAAIIEYDGRARRPFAEYQARRFVDDEIRRQNQNDIDRSD